MKFAGLLLAGSLAVLTLSGCRQDAPPLAARQDGDPPQAGGPTTQAEDVGFHPNWPCDAGDTVGTVRFSPDGQQLWVSYARADTVVWDLKTGRASRLAGGRVHVWGLPSASRDGLRLAGIARDKEHGHSMLCCWDGRTGRTLFSVKTSDAHDGGEILSGELSPDGHYLAARGWYVWSTSASVMPLGGLWPSRFDHALFLWDVDSGRELLHEKLGGHNQYIGGMAFSPDGRWLATASGDKNGLRIWDVATRKIATTIDSSSGGVLRFSRDGSRLVVSTWGALGIFDTKTWKPALSTGELMMPAALDATGDLLVADEYGMGSHGMGTERVVLYDVKSQKKTRTITTPHVHVWDIDISPDGKCIVTADREDIRFWESSTGKEIAPAMRRNVPVPATGADQK